MDAEPSPPDVIDLRVRQAPAAVLRIPIFTHPMVFEVRRIEIGGEPAARARRHAFGAEHGHKHECKRIAALKRATLRLPRDMQRLVIELHDASKAFSDRAQMDLAQAILRGLKTVKIARDHVIDPKALDDAAQGGHVIWKRVDERARLARIGHWTVGGVESENVAGFHAAPPSHRMLRLPEAHAAPAEDLLRLTPTEAKRPLSFAQCRASSCS